MRLIIKYIVQQISVEHSYCCIRFRSSLKLVHYSSKYLEYKHEVFSSSKVSKSV